MLLRGLIVAIVLGLIAGAAALSYVGYGGESKSVKSARVGSSGGGYVGGRIK